MFSFVLTFYSDPTKFELGKTGKVLRQNQVPRSLDSEATWCMEEWYQILATTLGYYRLRK